MLAEAMDEHEAWQLNPVASVTVKKKPGGAR